LSEVSTSCGSFINFRNRPNWIETLDIRLQEAEYKKNKSKAKRSRFCCRSW
jgi:hypothetical protein